MGNLILLLACLSTMCSAYAQDQYKIIFGYDRAGNQTSQNRICINCLDDVAETHDSIVIINLEKENPLSNDDKNSSSSVIYAYPNPVTQTLRVEWLASDHVERVALFSWGGQQLTDVAIPITQSTVDIGFSTYPPGSYIVALFYTDKRSESFQIIKK